MRELDRDRLTELFLKVYEQVGAAPYIYQNRLYRVRRVTVTVAEIHSKNGEWTPMPYALTSQLLKHIADGKAIPS